jgi:hypothetical protein
LDSVLSPLTILFHFVSVLFSSHILIFSIDITGYSYTSFFISAVSHIAIVGSPVISYLIFSSYIPAASMA